MIYQGIDLKKWKPSSDKLVVIDTIPTRTVDLDKERSKTAILSWRWDLTPDSRASRNMFVAMSYARRAGYKTLLADVASVDQSLKGDDLMQSVLSFSRLYAELPVIAAYDNATESTWLWTMRRPWICYEVRAYYNNPTRVTYVGHLKDQGSESSFGFKHMVSMVGRDSFTKTILYLLVGTIGMMDISDFRFLLAEYVDIIDAAHNKMSRNDYLLTAAILAQNEMKADDYDYSDTGIASPDQNLRINGDQDIMDVPFESYSLIKDKDRGYRYSASITLDGQRVATVYHSMSSGGDPRLYLIPESNAESHIRSHLGLPPQPPAELSKKLGVNAEEPSPKLKVVFHRNLPFNLG